MLSKLKKYIAQIPKIIATIKSLITGITVIFLIVFFVVTLYKETREERLTIEAFIVYPGLVERGYSGEVIARQIMDEYFKIYSEALKNEDEDTTLNYWGPGIEDFQNVHYFDNKVTVKSIKPKWEQGNVSFSVPSAGISLDGLGELATNLFGNSEVNVSGEVVMDTPFYKLRVRVGDNVIHVKDSVIETLIRKTAKKIILATDPYELAVSHYLKMDNVNCKQTIDSVIKGDKKLNKKTLSSFYLLKGYVFEREREYEKAISLFDKAIKHDPNLSEAYLNKGIVQAKDLYDYHKAFESIDKCLELDSLNWDAHFNKAIACLKYTDMLKNDTTTRSSQKEGVKLIIEENFKRSIKHLKIYMVNAEMSKIKQLDLAILNMRIHEKLAQHYE